LLIAVEFAGPHPLGTPRLLSAIRDRMFRPVKLGPRDAAVQAQNLSSGDATGVRRKGFLESWPIAVGYDFACCFPDLLLHRLA
jgi:hypothetical protein